ncbi:N-acetylmuramoyl-L-alanine amidase [Antarcticibacterium sp. 1MA-6-2]|nr:N-acetylmuramoyl-L-alanine amidase [Antarcticibacterium sp. 1MA-6-2]
MVKILKLLFCLIFISCSSGRVLPKMVSKPIEFNDERKELSLKYLDEHYGIKKDVPEIEPKMIVIHWTEIKTLQESFDTFKPVHLSEKRNDIQSAGKLNVSAHYLVDRDGTIYRLMPETLMARHVIGLNHLAIGIENVGGTVETPLTDAQLKSNVFLVKYLSKKHPVEYVIGHYEYTLFIDHPFWLEKDNSYRTKKVDPGLKFMEELRRETKNLNLRPLPGN